MAAAARPELLRVSRKELNLARVNDLCCNMSNYRPGDALANGYGERQVYCEIGRTQQELRAWWPAPQWVNVRAGNPAVIGTFVP